MTPPTLWHASDDPHITTFTPRRAPTSSLEEHLVWAVDDAHVPAYWFPRECPRATWWIGERTSAEDRATMNGATRIHAIEWEWWARLRDARVFLYLMPAASFVSQAPEAGYYVSREAVEPLAIVQLDDLVRQHAEARVELRVVNDLWPLWDRVTSSTFEFSGIRLRNAKFRSTRAHGVPPRSPQD